MLAVRVTDEANRRRRRALRDVRRFARRHRRWAGAGLLGLGVLTALSAIAPPPPPTVAVTVASRDLAAGSVIGAHDVTSVDVPAHDATAATLAMHEAVGGVLAAPLAAGETVTPTRLLGDALLTGTPADTVALPVRVADPGAAALVRSGDRIDLMVTVSGEQGATVRTVGRDLPVVLAPTDPGSSAADAGGLAALTPGDATTDLLGGLLVVAARPDQVSAILAGSADGALWLAVQRSQTADTGG